MIKLTQYYIALNFLFLILGTLSFNGQDIRYKELERRYKNLLNNAQISIVGIVTDTDNIMLKDVDLEIDFCRPKNVWRTESEMLHDSMKINNCFSIQKKHYTSVSISFYKKGYYTQNVILYTGKKVNESDSALQTQFHVKLRKIGTLANLIKFDERIKYNVKSNNQSVCDLTKLEAGNLSIEVFPLGNLVPLKKYVFLDFDRDKQGAIIYERNNGRGSHAPAPKTYFLNFVSSNPSDGFILVDEENMSIKDLSFLTEAPQKNYATKKLVIPYRIDRRYYFYIRCGNYYGKGVIKNIGARNGTFNHDYSLRIEILFNSQSGNLNLRSL